MINERIASLREEMKQRQMDIYIIPTSDFHLSEYVGDYFKCREYITGFTGSAGTAVITLSEANLWTDGRYFIQAEQQLKETEVILRKSGEPGVPTIEQYLKKQVQFFSAQGNHNVVIGFDGRTISISEGKQYQKIVDQVDGKVIYEEDLIGQIWSNRPERSHEPVFRLGIEYAGETVESKLERLRCKMQEQGADHSVITGLDDIGWLLNLRGNDVDYCPVFLSYAVVSMEQVELYTDVSRMEDEVKQELVSYGVKWYPYDAVYERMKTFDKNTHVMLDVNQMNYALYRNLPEGVSRIECANPVILMKSMKNDTEIQNIRNAHIKDGVACTKFMHWLKTNVGKETISEMSVAFQLEEFRSEQEGYLGASFSPICAYKEHAAIVHYSSTPETNVELRPEGMILCDTGGHYIEGSTDITRTIALGEVSEEEKKHFTTVLCSMLNLANAKFLYGCSGMSLDYAAREPFWRHNLNYNHGTGHGVGYLGNIHEPPARFFWKVPADKPQMIPQLEEGMVITDEPGIYIEGSHGIRTENELLVSKEIQNEYGQFMHFEILTFVPIDLDVVVPEMMTDAERALLNAYHAKVREKIGPYLTAEEQEWLTQYTREI